MAEKSLHSAIDQILKGRDQSKGKTMLGYTVSSYKSVLDDLENSAYEIQYTAAPGSGGGGAGGFGGGFSSSNGLVITNGFTSTSTGVDTYQGQCAIEQYMSFLVKDSQSKNIHVTVERPSKTDTSGMVSGITLTNSSPLFPAADTNKEFIDSCKLALQGGKPFYVGIAVDLAGFGVKYFQRYYNEDNVQWDLQKLRTLASQKALFAEVFIPQGGTNYLTMHSPVSIDAPPPCGNVDSSKVMFKVWIPVPVLLLNPYTKLGSTKINNISGGGKQTVGSECSFVGTKYQPSKGQIEGFTPSAYDSVDFSKKAVYQGGALSKQTGFVRLYLDKSKAAQIEKVMGKFPESPKFTTEIWKGQTSQSGEDVSIQIGSGTFEVGKTLREFFQNFGKLLNPVVDADGVCAAFMSVGVLESGGDWGMFKECLVKKNGVLRPDGQGISAGLHQFTQKAGGILAWRDYYNQRIANSPDAPKLSEGFSAAIAKENGGTTPGTLKMYASQFASINERDEAQMAQIDVWRKASGVSKQNLTAKWFNRFGCSTAAELMAIFGAINHLPNMYDGIAPKTRSRGYLTWESVIKQQTSPIMKAKLIELVHWIEYGKSTYGAGYSSFAKTVSDLAGLKQIIANPDLLGSVTHLSRFKRTLKLFGQNNTTLAGWQEWGHIKKKRTQ